MSLERFRQAIEQPAAPVVRAPKRRGFKDTVLDWWDEYKVTAIGGVCLVFSVVQAMPAQQQNQESMRRIGEQLRPKIEESQLRQSLSGIASMDNDVAEQRYKSPTCVLAQRVVSGEPAYRPDGTIISAGATVCDPYGGTGITKPHLTTKIDGATGQRIMRPIVDYHASSNGEGYKAFVQRITSQQ